MAKILDAFEKAKILFRWTVTGGKTWGYWIGIHGKGRLPARSQKKYDRGGEPVHLEQLEEFMGADAFKAYSLSATICTRIHSKESTARTRTNIKLRNRRPISAS